MQERRFCAILAQGDIFNYPTHESGLFGKYSTYTRSKRVKCR